MEQHRHGEDGRIIIDAPADISPEVADVEAVEEIASAEVRIAEINAKRDVDLARLAVKAEGEDTSELDQLRGEVLALRAIVERIAPPEPEPEPEPIIVEAPPAPVEEPAVEEPPVVENRPPSQTKGKGLSWF